MTLVLNIAELGIWKSFEYVNVTPGDEYGIIIWQMTECALICLNNAEYA